jgi:hypothetical protein
MSGNDDLAARLQALREAQSKDDQDSLAQARTGGTVARSDVRLADDVRLSELEELEGENTGLQHRSASNLSRDDDGEGIHTEFLYFNRII